MAIKPVQMPHPATNLARPPLAKSLRGWAILPNPFTTARGCAARARWLTFDTGANTRFRYDGLDRLTHADNTSNVTQRQYPVDKTGNRTGKQTAANGAITPYSYEATSHRLTQTGTEARTYDAVGNPITIGARQLTYDDRSRLTVFVNGTTTRRYQYTGQGLRVRKWTSSNTSGNTYFVYNESAQLIGEYDNAGARVQEIIWLGNLPVGVIAGTAATPVLHYIESDHLGTPRVIVEATRNVGIWRWNQSNDPFGESSPNQNPDGDATSFTFNLRFAGQYRDSESGWYYNVHRYYDPSIGRYLESDPIGLNGGISTYSYVGAAPLTANDPLGLFGQSASQAFAGAYSGGRMNQIQGQGRFQQAMSREYSVGLGGTAFGSIKGGSLGVSVAVSGWALSIVGQSCFGLGGGAFIGGGLQFGAQNVTSCDLEKDSWISHQLQFEGGKGVVGGAAIDLSGSGISVNPSDKLKLGVGAGGYAAGMMCINGRWIIVDWR